MALQLPWQRVSAFLNTDELLTLRTASSAFDVGELGGQYGPLLSFLLSAHVTATGLPVPTVEWQLTCPDWFFTEAPANQFVAHGWPPFVAACETLDSGPGIGLTRYRLRSCDRSLTTRQVAADGPTIGAE